MINKLIKITAEFSALLILCACSTYERSAEKVTTTTTYAADGKTVASIVVVEEGVKDVKEITDAATAAESLKEADSGCASDRALAYTNFTLGYGDVGLTWKSASGNSTRAPATAAASSDVFDSMAKVKAAGKTTIQTESLGVNTDKASTETAN